MHRRFREEGIVINYPMRTLKFPDGWGPDALSGVNGVRGAGRLRARDRSRTGRAIESDGGGGETGSPKMEEAKDPAAE